MASFLRLHPTDNVVVAVDGLSPGDIVGRCEDHPAHSAAATRRRCAPSAKDEPALKFGQIIGFATQDIAPGDWVHEHNIGFHAVDRDYAVRDVDAHDPAPQARRHLPGLSPRQWPGRHPQLSGHPHHRVNCSATVARLIAREVEKRGCWTIIPNIDGVIPLVHGHGCGMDAQGRRL